MATHTYQTLVEELGLHPRSIARRLFNELPALDWSLQPPEYNDLVTPSTTNSSQELLSETFLHYIQPHIAPLTEGCAARMAEPLRYLNVFTR